MDNVSTMLTIYTTITLIYTNTKVAE